MEKGEPLGFMKVVADSAPRKILGASILGRSVTRRSMVLDMMNAGVTCDVFERAVPIHPTVSELIPTRLSEMRPDAP